MKITVDVDIGTVLDELNDDDLVEEINIRGFELAEQKDCDTDHDVLELRKLIMVKDWLNAMAIFDRTFEVNGSRK